MSNYIPHKTIHVIIYPVKTKFSREPESILSETAVQNWSWIFNSSLEFPYYEITSTAIQSSRKVWLHIDICTRRPTLCRCHFQYTYENDHILTEIKILLNSVPRGLLTIVFITSSIGLVPERQQAVTWKSNDYDLGNMTKEVNCRYHIRPLGLMTIFQTQNQESKIKSQSFLIDRSSAYNSGW